MFGKRVKVERSWTVARTFLEVAGERVPTLGNFSFAGRARAFSIVKEKKLTFCGIMRILIYWSNKVSWLINKKNRPMINIKFLWSSCVLKSLYGKNEKNVTENFFWFFLCNGIFQIPFFMWLIFVPRITFYINFYHFYY